MKKWGFVLLVAIFFAFPGNVNAQVLINEFSSGTTSDWIELYNIATTSADLSTYKLMDSGTNDKILSGTIAPFGFATFTFSNWLNNTSDSVRLFKNGEANPVDSISYGGDGQVCAPQEAESIGRYPDGGNTIDRFATQTRDSSNNSATLNPCPVPTPTPAVTPVPTPSPSLSPSPTPAVTVTPAASASKTPALTVSKIKSPTPSPNILGAETTFPTSTDSGSPEAKSSPVAESGSVVPNNFPVLAVIFVVLGFGLMVLAGFLIFKNKKTDTSDDIMSK